MRSVGDGDFGDVNSVLLFQPVVRAVASPDYLARHGKMKSISEPGDHHLIDHRNPIKKIRAQHIHWENFARAAQPAKTGNITAFPDEQQAFNAAPDSLPARGAIYFVWPRDARPNPALDAFRDWLLEALGKYRDDRAQKGAGR